MALRELTPETKRIAFRAILGAGAIIFVAFVAVSLNSGFAADACAKRLVDAVAKKDAAYVERAVKTPLARDRILSAHQVEVGFVRPISSGKSRVGLFIRATETATRAAVVGLLLSATDGECEFVRDYESGPFSGGGEQ